MRMSPECIPCLIRRVLFEAEEVDADKAVEAVRNASEMLGDLFGEGVCSATVATKVHRETYRILGSKDPYRTLKRKSNEIALELYPAAEKFVKAAKDPLRAAQFRHQPVHGVCRTSLERAWDMTILRR